MHLFYTSDNNHPQIEKLNYQLSVALGTKMDARA